MKWSEINTQPAPRVLRQFACACLAILVLATARQYRVGRHELALALILTGVVIGLSGFIWPRSLRWLFVGWMKIAFPLNLLVSELVLALMFYLVLSPLALVFRLMGRDSLNLKAAPERGTFWAARESNKDPRRYFRQY